MNDLNVVALSQGGGPIGEVARTFGVDWPHLIAQMISFGIVCGVLYLLAYKPILRMLAARREQIASGRANAAQIKAELSRIDADRREVLRRADDEGQRLIEDARAAGARLLEDEQHKALSAGQQILAAARDAAERERAQMLAEVKREVGRLVIQTSAAVTGKVLTPEDHRRLAEETARQLAS
jgi:F-type H+-transporting ATPase subunit b